MWLVFGDNIINTEECKVIALRKLPQGGITLTAFMKTPPDVSVVYSDSAEDVAVTEFKKLAKTLGA